MYCVETKENIPKIYFSEEFTYCNLQQTNSFDRGVLSRQSYLSYIFEPVITEDSR